MSAKVNPTHRKKYEQNLKEGWDVVLPPLPIEKYNPKKAFAGVQATGNWANFYLGITENISTLLSKAKRKIHVFVLDTSGLIENKYILGVDNTFSKSFTGESKDNDRQGHGTHCAGIICADHPDMPLGLARELAKAGKLKISAVKVLNDSGAGQFSWIARGIKYVNNLELEEGTVKIISLSLGAPLESFDIKSALEESANRGIFVFAAAGNDGHIEGKSTVNYPGWDSNTICVGSIDEDGSISYFSSTGDAVDYVSPGRSIWSTYLNNTLVAMSGTSMATPSLVGVAAWLLSINENITKQSELNSLLKKHITDLGDEGKDIFFGNGVPKIDNYLKEKEEEPPVEEPPVEEPNIDNTTKWITASIIVVIIVGILLYNIFSK